MEEPKVKDIVQFISIIEKNMEDLDANIELLENRCRGRGAGNRYSLAVLKREKEDLATELEKFRDMSAAELVKNDFKGFDRLSASLELEV